MGFINELKWRGMLQDIMPGTEEQLNKEITTGYIGFDPTAKSLHIGNLATIMLLKQFQMAGHKPIALVGGATGMIGDPSGKSAERSFLSEETLQENLAGIRKQLEKFLDFDSGENSAEIVNNYDWFKDIGYLQFLREAGKFLTINYMSAKDSVKKRVETGISYTEFSYQLIQGYDYYHLYKNKNVKLQMGGSDQWGNITTGTEFIRRKEHQDFENAEYSAYALTTPLLTKADGTKFGKSEGGNVWLDPEMTSPYEFYQFWINQRDEDCSRLLRVYGCYLTKEQIEEIEAEHAKAPHLRHAQKALAKEVTVMVHGQEAYETAVKASEVLFGKATLETLKSLDEKTFKEIFTGVPQSNISKSEINEETTLLDLISTLSGSEIYKSRGEARKAVQANAVSVNKERASDFNLQAKDILRLHDKYILIGKGRRNHLIELV